MAPVTQYVFAEMLGIAEHFTAGSHEWLPYSKKHTFLIFTSQTPICRTDGVLLPGEGEIL